MSDKAERSTERPSSARVLTALGATVKRLEKHSFVLAKRPEVDDTRTELHVWGDERHPYMSASLYAFAGHSTLECVIYVDWNEAAFTINADLERWDEKSDDYTTLWMSGEISGSSEAEFRETLTSLAGELETRSLDAPLTPER